MLFIQAWAQDEAFGAVRAAAIEEGSEVLIAFSLPPQERALRVVLPRPRFPNVPDWDRKLEVEFLPNCPYHTMCFGTRLVGASSLDAPSLSKGGTRLPPKRSAWRAFNKRWGHCFNLNGHHFSPGTAPP